MKLEFEHLHTCNRFIEESEARDGFQYSFILSVRDCTQVLSPINPDVWKQTVSGTAVKECVSWHGLNDKAMLLRREQLHALGSTAMYTVVPSAV